MPTNLKGCKVPANLKQQVAASFARHGVRLLSLPDTELTEWDWRDKNVVTPVKDQMQCGDCYNFSAVSVAESASIIGGLGTNVTINFSEQCTLDCSDTGGCDGGWPSDVLDYIKSNGVANTKDYGSYRGGAGRCKNVTRSNKIVDHGYVGASDDVPSVQLIKNAMIAHGPISVAIAADDAFANYKSGVFNGSGSTDIDHAVVLVGWKDDSTVPGGGYWILRNSWNTSWGEDGYIRISYTANRVGFGAQWCIAGNPIPPAPTPEPIDWTKA